MTLAPVPFTYQLNPLAALTVGQSKYAPLLFHVRRRSPDLYLDLQAALANPIPIALRDYQVEGVVNVGADWAAGHSTLVVMTMGMGKTETLLGCLQAEQQAGRMGRAIIIAHRSELITQPLTRILRGWPDLPAPGLTMAQFNHPGTITIATIQTLVSGSRLDDLIAASNTPITHLIIDEAHHAVAKTYLTVIERLRAHNPALRVLGVTATPKRTDKMGLRKVFSSVALRIGLKDAIVKYKALTPFEALAVELPVKLDGIRMVGSGEDADFDQEELGRRMMTASDLGNPEEIIIETWKKQAGNLKTMFFCASVDQAYSLARAFREAGITAEAADGTTKRADRERIIRDFKSGRTQVLLNCNLWTEGFDVPEIECIGMAKPTKSDLVALQCLGRGLRPAPGKTHCLFLCYVPMDAVDIVLPQDLLGKTRKVKKAEAKAQEKGVILGSFAFLATGEGIDGDPDEVHLRVLDFFAKGPGSKMAWTYDGGIASCSIGEAMTLVIVTPQLERLERAEALRAAGNWTPKYEAAYQQLKTYQVFVVEKGQLNPLGRAEDWEAARMLATDYADENAVSWLSKRNIAWRRKPCDGKQLALVERLGLYQEGMTKGQASQAISHYFARSALQKAKITK